MPRHVNEFWEYHQVRVNRPRAIGTQNRNGVAVGRATNRVVEALLEVAILTLMKSAAIPALVDITSVPVVE